METITRLNLEVMITGQLNRGESGLTEAVRLATLEFEYPEDVIPHLEEAFYMGHSTDEVLNVWSGILNDFAKVSQLSD